MGNDGGTIQKRAELVKLAKGPEKRDENLDRALKWHFCAISQELLRVPVVADDLGRLYNKESVVKVLLEPKAFGDGEAVAPHITSLKDVTTLHLTPNPSYTPASSNSNSDNPTPQFICPISMREMNGRIRFVYLPCGHVASELAIKELGSASCSECGKEFGEEDVVPINPKEEELPRLKERMAKRKQVRAEEEAKKKAEKRAAKVAKAGGEASSSKSAAAVDSGVGTSGEEVSAEEDKKEKKRKRDKEREAELATAEKGAADDGLLSREFGYAPPKKQADDKINLKLPDLSSLDEKVKGKRQSEAVASIYSKKEDRGLAPLFQGTFGR